MKAVYVGHRVIQEPLFPTLSFSIVLVKDKPDIVGAWIIDSRLTADLGGKNIMIARSHTPQYCILRGEEEKVELAFEMDPWRLEKIEEFREGRDMWLRIDLRVCQIETSGLVRYPEWITVRKDRTGDPVIKIAKSEWVEEILPKLGLRRIRIIEIPSLEVPDEFKEISECIEGAWKSYLRGDYDDVVMDCRKCLITLGDAVRKLGYEKTEEKNGEKRKIPDWKKLFKERERLAEDFQKVFRGAIGFTQPESHRVFGTIRSEAEFILLTTYSIINYVLKTILKKEKS